jgi:hypothetical protein
MRSQRNVPSLFLAERYVPAGNRDIVVADAARAHEASRELAEEGTIVRHLGSTLVPSDEVCLALFEASSAEAVQRLIERAALPYQRVVEAVQIGAPLTVT